MIDQLRAALGLNPPPIEVPDGGTLYGPDPDLWKQEPGATRNRVDLSNTTLSAGNPVGSAQLPRRLFRYLRVSSYFNGAFVLSTTRLPTTDEVAQAAAGVANDPSGFDGVFRPGDQRILDFGDVAERNIFIQCQLIGGGLSLPAGAIVIEVDTEKFEARVDTTGIAIAPPTVPVPPLSPLTAPKLVQAVNAGVTNIAIPAGATGFLLVLYGNVPARSKGTVSIIGDVSGTEYVPSSQQTFFAPTTILTGITPTDANIAVTLAGPYSCQLFWLGLVNVAGTVNIGNVPSVSISGTPNVNIASGTVNIGNTPNITISGQTVTVGVNQPQTSEGSFTVPNNGNNTKNVTPPAGTHALGLTVDAGGLLTLLVTGTTSGTNYLNLQKGAAYLQGAFVAPIFNAIDATFTVKGITDPGSGPTVVRIADLSPAEAVFIFDNQQEPAAVELINELTSSRSARPAGQSMIAVIPEIPTGTWTKTVVAVPASGTFTLLAANSARRGVVIDANQGSGIIGVGLDTSNAFVFLPVNGYYDMPSPITTAQLVGLTTAAGQGGNIIVYEIT